MLCKKCTSINLNKKLGESIRWDYFPSFSALVKSADSGCELCQLVYSELRGKVSAATARISYSCGDKTEGGFQTLILEASDRGRSVVGELDLYAPADSSAAKNNLIAGRPISAEPLSDACIAQIQQWLSDCTQNHHRCPLNEAPRMPTRLIDVGDEYTRPRLRINAPVDTGKWVALSHCWGDVNKLFTTRVDNIHAMKEGINIDDMPATLRDAVLVTRKLGLQYLWSDNLCIIQGNDKDFGRENVRMGEYYRNAYLTIVASDAHSDDEGFLRPRLVSADSDSQVLVPLKKVKSGSSDHYFIAPKRSSSLDSGIAKSVIHERAWCLQESMLAVRVIEFTNQQVKWYCSSRSIDEAGRILKAAFAGILTLARQALNATTFTSDNQPKAVKRGLGRAGKNLVTALKKTSVGQALINELPDRSFRLGNFNTWYDIVEDFMSRNISYTSDRLPAIGAIARVIREQTGNTYIAGIWKHDILRGLAWSVSGRERETYKPKLRDAGELQPPSWSWASVEAAIHYPVESRDHSYRDDSCWSWSQYPFPEREKHLAKVIGHSCERADMDEFGRLNGGSIRLQALCRPARDLESSFYSQTKLKRKAAQYRQSPSPNTWQIYWDRLSRFESEKSDTSLEPYKLCMLFRGPYMYSTRESTHAADWWSHLNTDQNVRPTARIADVFLTVALVLGRHESGDWKRYGLVEVYDNDGWAPGVDWRDEDLTIV